MTNERREEVSRLVEEAQRNYLEEVKLAGREFEAFIASTLQGFEATRERITLQSNAALSDERKTEAAVEDAKREIEAALERIRLQSEEAQSTFRQRKSEARARFETMRIEAERRFGGDEKE